MRCADCKWKYPDSFLHSMFMNGGYTEPICGICALERVNRVGIRRERFQGNSAELMRLSAIEWRETHPADKPE